MIHKTTRSILSVLLAALLLVTSVPLTPAFADGGAVSPQSESGEGGELKQADDGTYLIYTAENLKEFADIVNGTHAEVDRNNSANARLMNDIDLSSVCGESLNDGTSWEPIGNSINQYRGNFNGDGHTISGLYIDSNADEQGLFGYVDPGGTVQNLSVSGSVKGKWYVGGVVGFNFSGTVTNCAFSGSVSGSGDWYVGADWYVGGVVGYNSSGTVENCHNIGEVSGNYVGGVVGYNDGGRVKNCYNTGSVSGPDSVSGSYVGGVVGWNSSDANVTNCYNTGDVSVTSGKDSDVGGVVGDNSGTVENCYNTGEVSGPDSGSGSYVGGVVGNNSDSSTVTGCYFLKDTAASGIGGGKPSEDAKAVDDLDALCDALKGDTWTISENLNRPVLTSNHEDDGSEDHPYEIFTAAQLEAFRDLVNGKDGNPNAHAKLMNDIDLKDVCGPELDSEQPVSWTPIGSISNSYKGTFDGNGHTISGLYIDSSSADDQGLFGYVGSSGKVQNLSVSGSVSGRWHVGGVVGYNNGGTVTGCIFSGSGSVSGDRCVGGIVGYNGTGATVSNCYNTGTVTGTDDYGGGVVGYNDGGRVENCYNTDSVKVSGRYVGGVVGYNQSGSSVTTCYNTGTVSGSDYVGGVVGENSGSNGVVENCHNAGKVSGRYVGGVVGSNSGTVENCYNTDSVSDGTTRGGVVGQNSGSVTNCYFLQQNGVPAQGIGIGSGSATGKNDTAFHSGEVAWLLENGQTEDQTTPVWGQNLMNEPKDNYPQLRAFDADTPQVYKVAFMNDSEEHDAKYANSGMTVTIPAAPSREGHTFTGWSDGTSTYQAGAKVEITSDTKFTAQWTKDTVNYTVTVTASPAEGGTVNGGGTFTENDSVTVSATPASGYTFVEWQEDGEKIENAAATYTFELTGNRNLTAIFEKDEDPTPTPTPTPDPTPSGPSTGDSTGWDDIRDELENAENGDEITIDMGDETKVPAEIFESLAGKDVEISFDLGDIQWSVNGADIPTDTDFTDLDLGASLGTSGIPVNVINTITGEVGTVQITLAHNGEFGFTMTLTAPLGKENAGYWANLYHYDESAEAMNFEAAAKIDEDGSVTIPFSHASQYAIVIDTHSHATVDVSDLFIDIAPDAWYKDAIQYAYDNGLMTGVSADAFAPEQTTTRAMIVSILARLEGVESAQAAGFADVDDEWYATAVNWAANVGVVNGYEDNTFKPNTAITREQLAAILMNYAAYKGEDVSNRADLTSYTDQPSTWAEEAMQWAVAEGLISGVTNDQLQPQGNATRAQVAAILQRYLEA